MADVVKPASSVTAVSNNGGMTTFVNIHGTAQKLTSAQQGGINVVQTSGEIETNLTNRFDDRAYYAGSGV